MSIAIVFKRLLFYKKKTLVIMFIFIIIGIIVSFSYTYIFRYVTRFLNKYDSLNNNHLYVYTTMYKQLDSYNKMVDIVGEDNAIFFNIDYEVIEDNVYKIIRTNKNYKKFGLPFYDNNILEITSESFFNKDDESVKTYVMMDRLAYNLYSNHNDNDGYFRYNDYNYMIKGVFDLQYPEISDFTLEVDMEQYIEPYILIIEETTPNVDFSYTMFDLETSEINDDVRKVITRFTSIDGSLAYTGLFKKNQYKENVNFIARALGIFGYIPLVFSILTVFNTYQFIMSDNKKDMQTKRILGIRKKGIMIELLFECLLLSSIGVYSGSTLMLFTSKILDISLPFQEYLNIFLTEFIFLLISSIIMSLLLTRRFSKKELIKGVSEHD